MSEPWNKGLTKETDASVRKISETMKRKGIDNFEEWRKEQKEKGEIPSEYPELEEDGNLAELTGVIVGDGYIYDFPRTQRLRIVGNANNLGFAKRYARLVESVFGKKPTVSERNNEKAIDISLYQKQLSNRLDIPAGSKSEYHATTPAWIDQNQELTLRYLRGLYEAEGCFCVHEPTYTYKFIFSNRNEQLLAAVAELLERLNFHPHCSKHKVQISRKQEVYEAKDLIKFRDYQNNAG